MNGRKGNASEDTLLEGREGTKTAEPGACGKDLRNVPRPATHAIATRAGCGVRKEGVLPFWKAGVWLEKARAMRGTPERRLPRAPRISRGGSARPQLYHRKRESMSWSARSSPVALLERLQLPRIEPARPSRVDAPTDDFAGEYEPYTPLDTPSRAAELVVDSMGMSRPGDTP